MALHKFPLTNVQNVFEINEDEMTRTSKKFAGPVDPRCYWSYGASNSLS